ncbi:hypothetical protein BLNAU_284 [Blattamonas nauphoetae]|uniref:HTH La-type RNA-binding domain-containing protein n=1 Tax=Blattamonas nauphoetae TaxID=2049346 RepID=A0ABQ9YMJ3_9EUKA|nr:hypothetical protein BLNAU_284 [Blattamonas nauphoetae]
MTDGRKLEENHVNRVRKTLESIFSNDHYQRDGFLVEETRNHDGWIPIDLLVNHPALKKLKVDSHTIVLAATESEDFDLEIEPDKKIRRSHPYIGSIEVAKSKFKLFPEEDLLDEGGKPNIPELNFFETAFLDLSAVHTSLNEITQMFIQSNENSLHNSLIQPILKQKLPEQYQPLKTEPTIHKRILRHGDFNTIPPLQPPIPPPDIDSIRTSQLFTIPTFSCPFYHPYFPTPKSRVTVTLTGYLTSTRKVIFRTPGSTYPFDIPEPNQNFDEVWKERLLAIHAKKKGLTPLTALLPMLVQTMNRGETAIFVLPPHLSIDTFFTSTLTDASLAIDPFEPLPSFDTLFPSTPPSFDTKTAMNDPTLRRFMSVSLRIELLGWVPRMGSPRLLSDHTTQPPKAQQPNKPRQTTLRESLIGCRVELETARLLKTTGPAQALQTLNRAGEYLVQWQRWCGEEWVDYQEKEKKRVKEKKEYFKRKKKEAKEAEPPPPPLPTELDAGFEDDEEFWVDEEAIKEEIRKPKEWHEGLKGRITEEEKILIERQRQRALNSDDGEERRIFDFDDGAVVLDELAEDEEKFVHNATPLPPITKKYLKIERVVTKAKAQIGLEIIRLHRRGVVEGWSSETFSAEKGKVVCDSVLSTIRETQLMAIRRQQIRAGTFVPSIPHTSSIDHLRMEALFHRSFFLRQMDINEQALADLETILEIDPSSLQNHHFRQAYLPFKAQMTSGELKPKKEKVEDVFNDWD